MICRARDANTLSAPVARLLSRYVFRRRILSLIGSLGVGVTVLLAIILIAVLLDRFFAFSRPVRIAELSVAIAIVCAILIRPLIRLLRKFNPVDAAIAIETSSRIFDQRLITVVSHSGNDAMVGQLAAEVDAIANRPGAQPHTPLKPLLRPCGAAAFMLVVITALWPLPRLGLPQLLSRFFHPLADFAPVTMTRIAVQPGNAAVVDGRPLTVTTAVQSKMSDEPTLHLSDDGRTWTQWPMVRGPDSGSPFSYTMPIVDHDWRYFVTAGDATSSVFNVSTLRQPNVVEYRVHVRPPDYRHQPATSFTSTDGQLEAAQGSQVTIDIACTEPMRQIELKSPNGQLETSSTADPMVRQARFTVASHENFAVHLTGANGLMNTGYRLVIHPLVDRPPMVRLVDPTDLAQISAGREIAVHFAAADDHGISQLTLQARCTGSPMESIAIVISPESRNLAGVQKVTFRNHRPDVGDVVTLHLVAKDLAGQTATSEALRLLVCPSISDRVPTACLAPLLEGSAAADRLAGQLDSAATAIAESDLQRANNALSDAAETAPVVERSLFQMLYHSRDPDEAEAICGLIDSAAICRATIEETINTPMDSSAGIALLDRAAVNREQLRDSLRLMKEGRQSAVILADQAGLAAFDSSDLPRAPGAAQRVQAVRKSAGEQLADKIHQLELDPDQPDLIDQLQARVDAERSMDSAATPIDFPAVDKTTDPLDHVILAARLFAAAKAETLRPDGDLGRANDLVAQSVSLMPKPGLPLSMLLSFRANAAAFRNDDAQTDAIDGDRRRLSPRSDLESSISKLTTIGTTLRGFAAKIDMLSTTDADLGALAGTINDASKSALGEAAAERLVAAGVLSPLCVDRSGIGKL